MLQKNHTKLLLILFTVALIAAVRFSGIDSSINLQSFKDNKEYLLDFVSHSYATSVLLYILLYIATVLFSLPIAALLTLGGGFLFGMLAIVYVNIGATIGSVCIFLIFRYFLGTTIQQQYTTQLTQFNDNIAHYGTNYLLTIRLTPIFPFFLVNILAAVTKIPLRDFVWTTSLGIIPGSLVYAYAGKQIGTINSLHEIFSANVIAAFIALFLFSLLPIALKKYATK